YDRATGETFYDRSLRPACNDGVIGANRLLYLGPWLCDCNLTLLGTIALSSAGDFRFDIEARTSERLERTGHTIDKGAALKATDIDWPTYRATNDRKASTSVVVPTDAVKLWKFVPGAPNLPTPPVAAGGLIFLGGSDCAVRAIEASTGIEKWSYLTAGSIMRSPTFWRGRVYVGSGDGYIYCLDAAHGTLLWRFRASPVERRIMVYGSLSSTWPVNSGVLVQDGVAYAAAGIIDFDGTYVYALDAVTGEIIWQNNSSGHLDARRRKGVSAQGILTIADGKLLLAGGNMISPGIYDLADGTCLNEPPGDRKTNRGEEIAVLNGRYIVLGGRLQRSARKNVVSPAYFEAHQIIEGKGSDKRKVLNKGRICPAWNDELIVFVDGRNLMPSCFSVASMDEYLQQDVRASALPSERWTAQKPKGSEGRTLRTAHSGYRLPVDRDTVSLAIVRNAVIAVYETVGYESHQARWSVAALDINDGSVVWEHDLKPWGPLVARANMVNTLAEPALPGGLLVDRAGRVVVVLENGSVVCFGEK
ncbi:PQQ-binding-like beta-propeller repeat protein, partial [Candidatus Latescibacterota bacterium]